MATQLPTKFVKESDYMFKIDLSVICLKVAYNVLIIGPNFVENAYKMEIPERLSQR